MLKIVKCPCCGHEKTFEACDTCAGKGLLSQSIAETPQLCCGQLSVMACPDCQGAGVKDGKVVTRN